MKIITSPTQEPILNGPLAPESYERCLDPWHTDAFPQEFKYAAPNTGIRKEGWMGLDHWGNQVLFVPDGTEIEV